LLTGPEKANAIVADFSRAHNNTMLSPLEIIVDEGCSILQNNVVNSNPSNLASPRELKKIIKNVLKTFFTYIFHFIFPKFGNMLL
jgi:hypothetical protein